MTQSSIFRKFLFKILIIVIIVVAADFIIGYALNYFYFKQESGLLYRTTYSFNDTDQDVLIFGSSRANHHYVPEVFEDSLKMSYYNVGRDGNNIFYHSAILRSTLLRYTPKKIILDVNPYEFVYNARAYDRISSLLPYYKTNPEIKDIILLKSKFEQYKLISKIYPYNSLALTIAIGNTDFNKTRRKDNKGFVSLKGQIKTYIAPNIDTTNVLIDTNTVRLFTGFIQSAKKTSTELYIVVSPMFDMPNDTESIQIAKSICEKENVPFLDYSRHRFFYGHKHYFKDYKHLNYDGAKIFTSVLVNDILNPNE